MAIEGDNYIERRKQMVKQHLISRGIEDKDIILSFLSVPREKFVPDRLKSDAYLDRPLPIGEGQTISQPYIVALMIEALNPGSEDRILEVGVGSGYAAALLSKVVSKVHGVERYETLAKEAEERLDKLGYNNVKIHVGDGTKGWQKAAPYDGIMVSAAAPEVPNILIEQLAVGGYLVIPVGNKKVQKLYQVEKISKEGEISKNSLGNVRFVPLIGEKGW